MINDLEKEISDLGGAVNSLLIAIDPILRQANPAKVTSRTESETRSHLSEKVAELWDSVMGIKSVVQDATDRVDIPGGSKNEDPTSLPSRLGLQSSRNG